MHMGRWSQFIYSVAQGTLSVIEINIVCPFCIVIIFFVMCGREKIACLPGLALVALSVYKLSLDRGRDWKVEDRGRTKEEG